MQRTKIVNSEVGTGTTVGTATSINSATCVRLYNNTSGVSTVGIATEVGAITSLTFSMPPNSVEFVEKLPYEVLYASPAIKAAKVGFTN